MQSVELVLDPVLDQVVRGQWAALQAAGLPNLGRHTGASNRPHVTLAVAQGVGPSHEDALPGAVAAGGGGEPVLRLGGLVVWGRHKHVLARLVVVSPPLLALHGAVAEAWADTLAPSPTTAVGAWTPHVTLALHLNDAQVARALTALRTDPDGTPDAGAGSDDVGRAAGLRRWDSTTRTEWWVGGTPG